MRKSAIVGIAVYVAVVSGVIGGAYAAYEAAVGIAPTQSAALGEAMHGPGSTGYRKWTPVEIKREVTEMPPLPAYVVPSNAERARVAKKVQKKAVASAQATEQRLASYVPAQLAYAPVEERHSFGPFGFKF